MFSGVTKLPKCAWATISSTTKMNSAANVGISDECRSRNVRLYAATRARGGMVVVVVVVVIWGPRGVVRRRSEAGEEKNIVGYSCGDLRVVPDLGRAARAQPPGETSAGTVHARRLDQDDD